MYKILVANQILTVVNNKEEAEKLFAEVKNSYLAIVHPQSAFKLVEFSL